MVGSRMSTTVDTETILLKLEVVMKMKESEVMDKEETEEKERGETSEVKT